MKPLTDRYIRFLQETPKASGRPYSPVYIRNIGYYVDKIAEPVTVESINAFVRAQKVHPPIARSLGVFLCWTKYGKIGKALSKEQKNDALAELYIPPIKPQRYSHAEKVISEDEVVRLCTQAPAPWDTIFRLMFDTDLRKAELLSIKVGDLDYLNNRIGLDIKGGYEDVRHFNDSTKAALRAYIKEQRLQKDDRLIGYSPSGFWSAVNRVALQVIGRKLNPHWVRHTDAQHLTDSGADDRSMMELFGWHDANVLKVYRQSSTASRKVAFDKFKKNDIAKQNV